MIPIFLMAIFLSSLLDITLTNFNMSIHNNAITFQPVNYISTYFQAAYSHLNSPIINNSTPSKSSISRIGLNYDSFIPKSKIIHGYTTTGNKNESNDFSNINKDVPYLEVKKHVAGFHGDNTCIMDKRHDRHKRQESTSTDEQNEKTMPSNIPMSLGAHLERFVDAVFRESTRASCVVVLRGQSVNHRLRVSWSSVISLRVLESESVWIDIQPILRAALTAGCDDWIVQLRSPEHALEAIIDALSRSPARIARRKIVLLPASLHEQSLHQLFMKPGWEFFPDLVVATFCHLEKDIQTNVSRRSHILGSYISYSKWDICLHTRAWVGRNPSRPVAIKSWKDTKSSRINVFPDKTKKMQEKLIKVGTFDYPPYTSYPLKGGFEHALLGEWLEERGAKWTLVNDPNALWGKALPNGSSWGVRGLLKKGQADVGSAGFFHTSADLSWLSQAWPHLRNELVVLAPRPLPLSVLYAPLRPFSVKLWVTTIAAYVLAAATLHLLGTSGAGPAPLLAWALLLAQSPPGTPRRTATRTLSLALCELFSLLSVAFAGKFAAQLTVPQFHPALDTAEQLAAARLPWSGTEDTWLRPLKGAESPAIATLVNMFIAMPESQMALRSCRGDFWGFIAERLPDRSILLSRDLCVEGLRVTRHSLADAHVGFLARKGWPLLGALSQRVVRLLDAGLVAPAIRRQVALRPNARANEESLAQAAAASGSTDVNPHKLTTAHISGALMLWTVGLGAAAGVFAIELGVTMFHKWIRAKKDLYEERKTRNWMMGFESVLRREALDNVTLRRFRGREGEERKGR